MNTLFNESEQASPEPSQAPTFNDLFDTLAWIPSTDNFNLLQKNFTLYLYDENDRLATKVAFTLTRPKGSAETESELSVVLSEYHYETVQGKIVLVTVNHLQKDVDTELLQWNQGIEKLVEYLGERTDLSKTIFHHGISIKTGHLLWTAKKLKAK